MSVQDLMKTLVDEIATIAKTETVVGEALQYGEHTVIPISKVSVGFGGGSGEGEGAGDSGGGKGTGSGKGSGGGGGGGVKVEPAAFIVIHGAELSILAPPARKGGLGQLFEQVPDLIEKIAAAQAAKGGKGGKKGEKAEPPAAES